MISHTRSQKSIWMSNIIMIIMVIAGVGHYGDFKTLLSS